MIKIESRNKVFCVYNNNVLERIYTTLKGAENYAKKLAAIENLVYQRITSPDPNRYTSKQNKGYKRLQQFENIMEKYNISSIEKLEERIKQNDRS